MPPEASQVRRKVVFRVDGGGTVGCGHLNRCAALARVLSDRYGCECIFSMREDPIGIAAVESRGWPVVRPPQDDAGYFCSEDAIIADLPGGVTAEYVGRLRRASPARLVIVMDGTCSGRLEADLVVCPIERLPDPADWRGFAGQRYEGPAYAILDPSYARLPSCRGIRTAVPRVLITMGASDPHELTLRVLDALDPLSEQFETIVALGPAFVHESPLRTWLAGVHRRCQIRREGNLLALMCDADLAIVSFGTTVYELAATGLPAVALCISEDHAESAAVFAKFGSLVSLGLYSGVGSSEIRNAVAELLRDPSRRAVMAAAGQKLVDGRGAERVADILMARIGTSSSSPWETRIAQPHWT